MPFPADAQNPSDDTRYVPDDIARLVDQIGDGLIMLDRDWRILYANEAARRISRIKPEDINGPSHWELFPATLGAEQERVYRRSMEERVSLEHEFYYPPFGVWISLRTLPVPVGIAVHYRDITRLKEAETSRDETARRLQQVLAPQGIGVQVPSSAPHSIQRT